MKLVTRIKPLFFALPLALGALVACGPDKEESPGEKTEEAVEEAGENAEEATEEVGDEVDDATDD